MVSFSSLAFSTMALAIGCSDIDSNESASCSTSLGEELKETRSATLGFPIVSVPVLSKTNVLTFAILYRYLPPFTSTPLREGDVRREYVYNGDNMLQVT